MQKKIQVSEKNILSGLVFRLKIIEWVPYFFPNTAENFLKLLSTAGKFPELLNIAGKFLKLPNFAGKNYYYIVSFELNAV
jgi:hypothetical protein